MIIVGGILRAILVRLASVIRPKWGISAEINTPFECGFDAKGRGHIPFSLRFYLIGVIFLVFDVEIVYLLPFLPVWWEGSLTTLIIGLFFGGILFLGTVFEWKEGALDWEWDYSLIKICDLHS